EHWRTTEPDPAMILPVSVWRGTVYAALENPLHTAYHDRNPDPMFGLYSHYPQVRRALCAVDAATGRLLWKLGGLYEGTADQTTSFLYATVYDGVLYAVGTRLPQFSEIHIYALNPVTGEVLWNLRACYGQQETTMFGRPARTPYPSLCAISGGNLYLCTNLGGVVSVNLARRCLNWISRYDHVPRPITKYTNTYYRPVGWANNPTFYTELDGRPWLVFAPADSDYAYGMDARSGEIVWRLDRHAFLGGGRVLVGLRGPTAWVASDGGDRGVTFTRAYGIDIRSGRVTTTVRVTPANRGDTVLLAGRPCLAGNRMFWPGYQDRECMVCELDLDSGRVAASAYVPATYAGIGYSVFAQNGILFTVAGTDYSRGAGQLAVRFNQSAILDAARKAAEADTGNADAALRYGLLCLRLGDAAEAVRRLKAAFDLASRAPVNTRVRDHASRALVAWHLKRADASLAARRYTDAMGSVQSAREFALSRSQRSDCFVREEAALQGLAGTRALRELYEGLVQNDPDFGVGEDPEIPARLYGLIRLAAMLETAEPETAARMYQEIQESPDRLAWQGTPLRVLGLHRLRALVKTHGVKLYAAQEQAAQKLLDANTAETLAELLRRYPLAECADEAALRLAGRALARGDGSAAVAVLLAALEDNTARPRRAELQATLALAHARAGEKLRARLVAARTLREFPDGKLRLGEGETRFADVLGPLVAAGANAGAKSALPRLPARPVALWSRDWEPGSFTRVPAHPAHSAMSRVYLGERSQQGLQVTALDGPSGEVVWSRASDVTLMAAHDTDYGVLFETAQGFGLYEDSGTERWSLAVGATPSQASLEGGMLVFSTRFTNTTTRRQMVRVHALDVSSGGRLWQQEFEASMVRWIGQCPHGVLVLLSGGEQKLYLLDAETGAEIRSVTVDLSGQVNVTPALDGDRLWLVDVFGQVRAYGTRDLGAGATFATGQRGTALLRVEEGRLVLAGLEGATCLEAATGKTLWSRALDRGEMLRAAHHSPGLVYLCTRNAAGESRVTAVRAGDGSVAMRYLAPRAAESDRMELQGSFAFDGGLAVGYSVHSMVQGNMQLSEFRLVVLDNDGSQRLNWSTPANNARAPIMQIAVTDGFLLLGCADTTFCFGHRP
ncbi:MAG: PQQ-binding-like beta-propeller repeat protein, partial [Planctomycetes bacterium]|nr:PQQ-binding-like beta-propeller repeat protein [Planctomycetota bacterium]